MAKKRERRAGRLVVIGGAEDREGRSEILREFVRFAGGAGARLVVISAASDSPKEVAARYVKTFRRPGARKVCALDVAAREDADGHAAHGPNNTAPGRLVTGR